ncbi:MAG TPA: bifunctional DNA primase/polymerase [Actinocrinis sp.]|uniref:bifunctional DNA primase/polymerase n=1 Tax=Actinocrinis sp. TaxID=1920516 RepID=UPI002DDD4D35|nr:bifunctional DNA primase/polymerase [Actinocrinis sp.]HEV2342498.1 bifunctional DNA primase/polymerase [Actinocrinis sp.]
MTSPTMTPSAATDWLGVALALAERGFAVFPLRPGTKVPAVRGDWEGLAVADPARLREVGWPSGANVGVACGPSGLFVLDLDVAKGPSPADETGGSGESTDGAVVLRELAAGRPIPDTFTVATPSGGTHLYFRAPSAPRLRNTVARLGPLIDTRAVGGYVVGPGSTIGGRRYEIAADQPVAPVPRWIVRELIAKARAAELPALPPPPIGRPGVAGSRPPGVVTAAYGAAALRNEVERVLAARVGTRNDTLNRAAYALGRLIGAGILDRDLAASELYHAARRVGLPARESSSTLASGLGAGIARPRFPARSRPLASAARTVAASFRTGGEGEVEPSVAVNEEHEVRQSSGDDHMIRDQFGSDVMNALRAVDRAYDAAALCAAPLVFSREWRRIRALVDALRDLRDSPRSSPVDVRRAASLCEAVSSLAGALPATLVLPGRKRARSPLGNALRDVKRAADAAIDTLARADGQTVHVGDMGIGARAGTGAVAVAVGSGA